MRNDPSPRLRTPFVLISLAGCASAPAAALAPPAERRAAMVAPELEPAGPYVGQRAGDAPSIFAPGFVSRRYHEMNATFSPDGAELYFSMKDVADRSSTILVSRLVGGRWQPPRVAPFSGRYDDVDPMVSPDGTRLYFSSYRPREPGAAPAGDADIWYVERRGGAFGEAVHVGAPVSTPRDDFYPSLARDGTIYYSNKDPQRGSYDIVRARPEGGTYRVEYLGAPVNTGASEYDPFVAPDESYLIFASGRPGGRGDSDLYVSFRDGVGWSEPVNLGGAINSSAREYCPFVSPDGKYFFFTSKRGADAGPGGGAPAAATFEALTAGYDAVENGLGNVYWLKSDFLHGLRPTR
jgi:WD40 repeat protein